MNNNRDNTLVTVSKIKKYLKETYRLSPEQIDALMKTTSTSLQESLAGLEENINRRNLPEVANLAHTLKGILLNCGELYWGEYVQQIEKSARAAKEELDYGEMCHKLKNVLLEVTNATY